MYKPLLALALVFCMNLTACGAASDSADIDAEDPAASISIQTARGEVTIPGPATRVVALEWAYAENVMALGETPIGVADMEGYAAYVTAAGDLPDSVEDVGTRQEPNLEAIAALSPDLIVSDSFRLTSNYEALTGIAPVLAFDPYAKESTQLESMKAAFTELAKAMGKEAEAEEQLAALDDAAEETSDRLETAGLAEPTVAIGQAASTPGAAPAVRMFTSETLVMQVLATAGIETGWPGKPDDYGFTTVGAEALKSIPAETEFLYSQLPSEDLFTEVLPEDAVWNSLAFVESDNVQPIDPGTWFYGGPLSGIQMLTETAKALGT